MNPYAYAHAREQAKYRMQLRDRQSPATAPHWEMFWLEGTCIHYVNGIDQVKVEGNNNGIHIHLHHP